MTQTDQVATPPTIDVDARISWLELMYEIRFFEDQCHRMFAKGLIRGTTHLMQGQEAVSVGACQALREGDTMTCTYRGHGAVRAMGAPLDRMFGEILGKPNGLCAGKGGSMHLTDVSVGALGSFAVVGAHLPISVGAALASKHRDTGAVSLCFFGDGSTNIGAFHEAMNLASIWKLPVIFVCENNLYGEYSPLASTTPIECLADRADAYAMAKQRIDGNDVTAVNETVARARERAVAGEGPTFLEALTYRHKGHSRSDPARYRPKGELEAWLERDPIRLLEQTLASHGCAAGVIDSVRARAEEAVAEALATAQAWDDPHAEARLEHLWA